MEEFISISFACIFATVLIMMDYNKGLTTAGIVQAKQRDLKRSYTCAAHTLMILLFISNRAMIKCKSVSAL